MIHRLLKGVLVLGGVACVAAPIAVSLARVGYPFQLEWMEGGSLDQLRRIAGGQPLYVPPSLEYVPFIYPPLYFYIAAAVAQVSGVSFLPLRAVSLLASVGLLAIMFGFVWRETRSAFAALMAIALFAATYSVAGAWWDLARCDMLLLFLVLAGAYVFRTARGAGGHALAGGLFALAFLAKQTALVVAAPLALAAVILDRRRGWWFGATFAALSTAPFLILDQLSGGWYRYYVLELPSRHDTVASAVMGFWRGRIGAVALAATMAAWFLVRLATQRRWKDVITYGAWGVGMIAASWLGLINVGGGKNVVLPAFAFIGVLFGLAIHELLAAERSKEPRESTGIGVFALMLALAQLAMLAYSPARQIPSREHRAAGTLLLEQLGQLEGEVMAPTQGYLAARAGKRPTAQQAAAGELLGWFGKRDEEWAEKWEAMLERAFRERRYCALILNRNDAALFRRAGLERWYVERGPVLERPEEFLPLTGTMTEPEYWFVPRDSIEGCSVPR